MLSLINIDVALLEPKLNTLEEKSSATVISKVEKWKGQIDYM